MADPFFPDRSPNRLDAQRTHTDEERRTSGRRLRVPIGSGHDAITLNNPDGPILYVDMVVNRSPGLSGVTAAGQPHS